jgi:RNA polymerase sigma-70 factor (ECF subfamily)
LIQRYVQAWESSDLGGLVALLQTDATLVMPPWTEWYRGRREIMAFLRWAFDWVWDKAEQSTFRIMETSANGQAALALYFKARGETEFHAHAVQLLTFKRASIESLTFFIGQKSFVDLRLPLTLSLGRRKGRDGGLPHTNHRTIGRRRASVAAATD